LNDLHKYLIGTAAGVVLCLLIWGGYSLIFGEKEANNTQISRTELDGGSLGTTSGRSSDILGNNGPFTSENDSDELTQEQQERLLAAQAANESLTKRYGVQDGNDEQNRQSLSTESNREGETAYPGVFGEDALALNRGTQERETMSALRKMTSFLGYAEPTGDDGYEDTYHHTADETYAEEFADGESEQLDDYDSYEEPDAAAPVQHRGVQGRSEARQRLHQQVAGPPGLVQGGHRQARLLVQGAQGPAALTADAASSAATAVRRMRVRSTASPMPRAMSSPSCRMLTRCAAASARSPAAIVYGRSSSTCGQLRADRPPTIHIRAL